MSRDPRDQPDLRSLFVRDAVDLAAKLERAGAPLREHRIEAHGVSIVVRESYAVPRGEMWGVDADGNMVARFTGLGE